MVYLAILLFIFWLLPRDEEERGRQPPFVALTKRKKGISPERNTLNEKEEEKERLPARSLLSSHPLDGR